MPNPTYDLISTYTSSSAQTEFIVFNNIPQTYTDLVIHGTMTATSNVSPTFIKLQFNTDTGANYRTTYFETGGTTYATGSATNETGWVCYTPSGDATIPLAFNCTIKEYAESSLLKVWQSRHGTANGFSGNYVGTWGGSSGAAINAIKFYVSGAAATTGSEFKLYGLKAE